MRIDVSLGQTRAPANTTLVPITLGEAKGDRVFLLLHIDGKAEGTDHLREECTHVLKHAALDGEGEAYQRLESALKEMNGLLKGLLLSGAIKDVHAIVGLLESSGALHISHVGRAEAYLIRHGTAAQITEFAKGKQPVAFMHIVSGPLSERDQVVLSTQRLLRTITPAQLASIAYRGGEVIRHITSELEGEKEIACIALLSVHTSAKGSEEREPRASLPTRDMRRRTSSRLGTLSQAASLLKRVKFPIGKFPKMKPSSIALVQTKESVKKVIDQFAADLHDPKRKRRAHLLLLAGAGGIFLLGWMFIQLSLSSQKSQTREQLAALVEQINSDLSAAENRQLTGDVDSANTILKRAEDRARQVMANESGLFRSEALNLLDSIRSKREQMNNVTRLPPRVMANLSANNPDIAAQGIIGLSDGEFLAFDRQDYYRILLNSVDRATRLSGEELIVDGAGFPRFQSQAFLTTGNSVLELSGGQAATMKTEDPAGWATGSDIQTYLRYLYILSPEKKQIYKYERLSGRYGPAAEYNVNGDLTSALGMTITGPIYVLKDTGSGTEQPGSRDVLKLLRGEKQPFTIRNLPPGALDNVTDIYKSSLTGNFYFLDPEGKRVIVTTNDGDLGDSLYLKQFVLESDQVGKLVDLYVDPEDTRLYVLDEKRLYVIDLQTK